MGYNYLFTDIGVTVFRRSDDSIAFKGVLDGQLYLVDFNDNKVELDTCLIANIEREMCPWAISKYFGDWVQTQVLKCENMLMGEQSANHK
jgi:hypothetical protein